MQVIKRTYQYLKTLQESWEQTAMQDTAVVTRPAAPPVQPGAEAQRQAIGQKFPRPAAIERDVRGLSVSV
jgi:hypothetical protein